MVTVFTLILEASSKASTNPKLLRSPLRVVRHNSLVSSFRYLCHGRIRLRMRIMLVIIRLQDIIVNNDPDLDRIFPL